MCLGAGRAWRDVARCGVCAAAEKVVLHLAGQILAGALVGQVQAVFVDQHGLVLEPGGPGFFADVFPDALAQLAGVGREVKTFGFFLQLDALDHTCHGDCFLVCDADGLRRPEPAGALAVGQAMAKNPSAMGPLAAAGVLLINFSH